MKKLVSTGRLFAFGLLVVALLALCVGTLYKLQIIEGAAYYEESQNKQVSEQTVTAARGNILDRYGRVLVSNRECYNLKISDTRLFSDEVEDPNAVILQMINMVEAAGDNYTDDLPITKEPPFEYTNMTDIQRMLLNAYLKDKGLDEDTTAVELMSYFRTRYDIAGSYNAEEMRKIASVRYAVNVRYAINTNPYVFVEDASIDLISDLMGVVGNVVEVETSYIREYNTQYAAHILGYVQAMCDADMEKYRPGKENSTYDYDTKVGKDGVELAFENWLHGTNGKATSRADRLRHRDQHDIYRGPRPRQPRLPDDRHTAAGGRGEDPRNGHTDPPAQARRGQPQGRVRGPDGRRPRGHTGRGHSRRGHQDRRAPGHRQLPDL